jgi:hypothetical protein
LPLTIIISNNEIGLEEHARSAVREVLKHTFNPYAPRLPEKSTVWVRLYCQEDHEYWAPMARHDSLCPEHRNDPEVRGKWAADTRDW